MFPHLRLFLTTLVRRKRFEDRLDERYESHLDAQAGRPDTHRSSAAEAACRAQALFGGSTA